MEIWKDIKNYEGIYQVSNFGRIRSIKRKAKTWHGSRTVRERILTPIFDYHYYQVGLYGKGRCKNIKIHTLVWDYFGDKKRNGRKLQIDHIDNDKTNNHIDNLQLLSNRENVSKGKLQHPKTSKYTGVHWNKQIKRWIARIQINGIPKHLGCYENEYNAHLCYQRSLSQT